MTKKSIVKTTLAVFSLMMLFNIGAFAQKTDCSKMTEADLVKAIYDKIKVKYDNQIIHINVRVKDNVVTLEGWATTKNVRKEIEKIAKKIKCVKKVDNKLTVGIGGGCSPGQKKCGDICIPNGETCNICTARTC
ncbi:MAG: BON domain-containing protein [Pyrinomonadaceae bacterium]